MSKLNCFLLTATVPDAPRSSPLPALRVLVDKLSHSVAYDALLSDIGDCDWGPVLPLAAALSEMLYESYFAISETEMGDLKVKVLKEPTPRAISALLGHRELFEHEKDFDKDAVDCLLPYVLLHRVVEDFPNQINELLLAALKRSIDPRVNWAIKVSPCVLMGWGVIRNREAIVPTASALQIAVADGLRWQQAQVAKDAAQNGRPRDALNVPKPELANSFIWWCLKLGQMIKSPHANTSSYVSVIDSIADNCLRTMPLAHEQARLQARQMRNEDPEYEDSGRYGTTENESLPKYARWLIKRGLYQRAEHICEMAIEHQIGPASTGAFDRSLNASRKKLASSKNQ